MRHSFHFLCVFLFSCKWTALLVDWKWLNAAPLWRLTACHISRDSCENRCDRKVVRAVECSYFFLSSVPFLPFFCNFSSFLLFRSDCVVHEVFLGTVPKMPLWPKWSRLAGVAHLYYFVVLLLKMDRVGRACNSCVCPLCTGDMRSLQLREWGCNQTFVREPMRKPLTLESSCVHRSISLLLWQTMSVSFFFSFFFFPHTPVSLPRCRLKGSWLLPSSNLL